MNFSLFLQFQIGWTRIYVDIIIGIMSVFVKTLYISKNIKYSESLYILDDCHCRSLSFQMCSFSELSKVSKIFPQPTSSPRSIASLLQNFLLCIKKNLIFNFFYAASQICIANGSFSVKSLSNLHDKVFIISSIL